MRTVLLAVTSALVSMTCLASGLTVGHTGADGSVTTAHPSCPRGSERARLMVENFLTNPALSEERSETGTSNLSPERIQLVQNADTCRQLNSEYSQYSVHTSTYYKAGDRYFVTLLLEQPVDPQKVVSGISIVVVLNNDLEKIESYGG